MAAALMAVSGLWDHPVDAADLITNGSFETGAYPYANHGDENVADLPVGSTTITGWTVTGGSDVAVASTGNRYDLTAEDGNISLDLTGYQDAAPYGGVTQSIPTVVGATYNLSFWLGDNNNNPLVATAFEGPVSVVASAGTTSSKFTNSQPYTGQQWQQFTLPFTAVASTTAITLTGASGQEYIGLDHVSVTPTTVATRYTQNFSSGNPTSYSDYNLVDPGIYTNPPGYRVINNPALVFTNGYTSYFDHTTGDASGAMLFFDGASDTTQRIWYDNIVLSAGVTYRFSYWGSAANDESTPTLVASIGSTTLPGILNVQNGIWSQYTTDITVPTSGTYTFAIRDTNSIALGNDGAIDDISVASYQVVATGGQIYRLPVGNGSTISVLNEPGIMINAGGAVTLPQATPYSARQLLVVTDPGLEIAGSTGQWTGVLDLSNNDMDLPGASLATVTDQIRQGYDNGSWNGTGGILSSSAAADTTHLTALGAIQNNQSGSPIFTTFDNNAVGVSDILVKFTYYGDANLDGKVDGSDYSLIDNGLLTQQTGWLNGDFNYDGVIDGSDYTLIDNAYNAQGVQLAAAIATAQIAGSAPVPEPNIAGLLGVAGVGFVRRKGRRPTSSRQAVSE